MIQFQLCGSTVFLTGSIGNRHRNLASWIPVWWIDELAISFIWQMLHWPLTGPAFAARSHHLRPACTARCCHPRFHSCLYFWLCIIPLQCSLLCCSHGSSDEVYSIPAPTWHTHSASYPLVRICFLFSVCVNVMNSWMPWIMWMLSKLYRKIWKKISWTCMTIPLNNITPTTKLYTGYKQTWIDKCNIIQPYADMNHDNRHDRHTNMTCMMDESWDEAFQKNVR